MLSEFLAHCQSTRPHHGSSKYDRIDRTAPPRLRKSRQCRPRHPLEIQRRILNDELHSDGVRCRPYCVISSPEPYYLRHTGSPDPTAMNSLECVVASCTLTLSVLDEYTAELNYFNDTSSFQPEGEAEDASGLERK